MAKKRKKQRREEVKKQEDEQPKLFPLHTRLVDPSFEPIKVIIMQDGRVMLCLEDLAQAFRYDASIWRMRCICQNCYWRVEWRDEGKFDFINRNILYLVAQGIAEMAAPAIERRIGILARQAKQRAFAQLVTGPFFDAPIEEDFGC